MEFSKIALVIGGGACVLAVIAGVGAAVWLAVGRSKDDE